MKNKMIFLLMCLSSRERVEDAEEGDGEEEYEGEY